MVIAFLSTFLVTLLALLAAAVVLLRLTRPIPTELSDKPCTIHDERDVIYVRQKLVPGTESYEEYYREHPEHKTADDEFRKLPGLLNPTAPLADDFIFRSVRGSLNTIYSMLAERDKEAVSTARLECDPQKMSESIKMWCLHFGALSAGICCLEDYHKYSHHGYYSLRGVPVILNHPYAVVFSVEMDFRVTMSAPLAPIWLETARQYEKSADIATQLSIMIRRMGWSAKPHYFDNYDVIAPLVARDAGLGQIGRMGILMTPKAGPRVRLAAVTTDLPLQPDNRQQDQALLDFCAQCGKCARCCPARAIPEGFPEERPDGFYWRINHEACYTFWARTGNPCGRCMAVCPLSHPRNLMALIPLELFRRSRLYQKTALLWDDFHYGSIPKPWPFPEWMRITHEKAQANVSEEHISANGKN
jgi:ferredoxin